MRFRRTSGFTLVELLVVIGIIALLISVLLPALNKARDAANTVKCAANLHAIGQGMAAYVTENHSTFPAAYIYAGMNISNGVETPATATNGYVHWSAFIFGRSNALDSVTRNTANSSAYLNPLYAGPAGWAMFQCPSIENGGLPAANSSAGNLDGGQTNDQGSNVVDFQAPRIAYTVNEAICPRNKFVIGFNNNPSRYYNYVRAGSIALSSQTILATEWNQNWKIVSSQGDSSGGIVCKSHRPMHAFQPTGGATDDGTNACQLNLDQIPVSFRGNQAEIERVSVSELSDNPDLAIASAPSTGFRTRLDWVGRNHGVTKLDSRGRNIRRSNFLYVDGHVETKSLYDTFGPWQWGMQMYSLTPNSDVSTQ